MSLHLLSFSPAGSNTISAAAFTTIQTDAGTSPVASGPNDTLTFTSPDLLLSGNSVNDTVTASFKAQNAQTGTSYTVQASDNGRMIIFNNAGTVTVTLPVLTVDFKCGWIQKGAGQVSFVTSSTTLRNRSSQTKSAGQYAGGSLYYEATNIVYLVGDTGA